MKQQPTSTTIVVSAQRSGLNWLRYCTEFFSGKKTPGRPLLISGPVVPPGVFDRTHDALGLSNRADTAPAWLVASEFHFDGALLLLRDYREIFVRQAEKQPENMLNYVGNIRYFDQFAGKKLLLHFEDFTQHEAALSEGLSFLNVPHDLGGFDMSTHTAHSRSLYDVNQASAGGSTTAADPTNMKFHQSSASKEELTLCEAWMRVQLGDLFERYLARYN